MEASQVKELISNTSRGVGKMSEISTEFLNEILTMSSGGSLEKCIMEMVVDRASNGILSVDEILAMHMMGIHPIFYEIDALFKYFTQESLMIMYSLGYLKLDMLEYAVLSTKIFVCELSRIPFEDQDKESLESIVDDLQEVVEEGIFGQPANEAYTSLIHLQQMLKLKYMQSQNSRFRNSGRKDHCKI